MLLRDPAGAGLSALNLAEVIDVMTRIFGQDSADTAEALALLETGGLRLIPVDPVLGALAGRLHARYYDRRTSPLSMADCVVLATALVRSETLATSDPALATAALAEGVQVAALPDAAGRRG